MFTSLTNINEEIANKILHTEVQRMNRKVIERHILNSELLEWKGPDKCDR